MGDFYNPSTSPKARKDYRCIYCYGPILKGEIHKRQTGNYDGAWQDNRFHDECWEALVEEGDFEFLPGSGEVPERVLKAHQKGGAE